MENGPVFSDIRQGCEVTNGVNNNKTYICSENNNEGTTELGCNFNWGNGSPTDYNLDYIDNDQGSLAGWTEDTTSIAYPACGSISGTTGSVQNTLWYNMSIVNSGSAGQQPSFNYPNTAISGWLCQSVDIDFNMWNNSAPEGQLFFQEFVGTNYPAILSVNGVSGCQRNEYVESGSLTYDSTSYGGAGELPAYEAIIADMTADNSVSLSCATMGQNRLQ
jgi:hypothetical protein